MRIVLLVGAAALIFGVSGTASADPCATGKNSVKIKCLNGVVARQDSQLKALSNRLDLLEKANSDLSAKLEQKTDRQELQSYVQYGNTIQLSNLNWSKQCLDLDTGNASHVQAVECHDPQHPAQSWRVYKGVE